MMDIRKTTPADVATTGKQVSKEKCECYADHYQSMHAVYAGISGKSAYYANREAEYEKKAAYWRRRAEHWEAYNALEA